MSGEIASAQSWSTCSMAGLLVLLVAEAVRPFAVALDVRHLIARRLVIRIENQDLGIGLLGLVELARPKIGVSLEKELLHGGDPILELVGHSRIVDRAFGIAYLLLVSDLLFLQILEDPP